MSQIPVTMCPYCKKPGAHPIIKNVPELYYNSILLDIIDLEEDIDPKGIIRKQERQCKHCDIIFNTYILSEELIKALEGTVLQCQGTELV